MKLSDSPITTHCFDGHPFYLKRDDLLHSQFSGNKARKFLSLLNGDFPEVHTLIGYGSAQANSLYSLSVLCACRGWKLKFYVDHIPSFITDRPMGNYRGAVEMGAEVIDLSLVENREGRHPAQYIQDTYAEEQGCMIIPEGGRSPLAEEGVKLLADEIISWKMMERMENLTVALPSGTGTTALYLQKHLHTHGIEVLTCACVGGEEYLQEQFAELDPDVPQPTVLGADIKHHFGRLEQENYKVWQELERQTHVEFELLYDPFMWRCLKQWFPENKGQNLLYIHQGGTMGNETMLPRYQRLYDGGSIKTDKPRSKRVCGGTSSSGFRSIKADW
ncbi:1-aminocyclopropane-1-carboxylate deaminase/D-cysteine desulfhydrase [Vibrio hannami]|uniref:1-aminocyclopropane-1-carboxylate deaminase/D-cysteine desulfhydrase n=1 Tax=Vibrio hannami TaxID=2717094 RepID=UPI00240EE430|nr:1-aminocyclopropane-1-carboxylate deaminase/D-cysteine desulfhydrase [Vibrio hannami]MDG3087901.1 1-aminocyclopropane-1-carboxylate deaminase/D-cysteine desulfhydrase [Vibrio hannami]